MHSNKTLFITILFFLFSFPLKAQEIVEKKWNSALQLDNRLSSIRSNYITIFGAKAGVQYMRSFRIGLGASFIANPVDFNYFNKKLKVQESNQIGLWYGSVFGDWIVYKNQKWDCFLTDQMGFGQPTFLKTVNGSIVSDVNIKLFVNELSAQADYNITAWLGAGVGFGYRNIVNKSSKIRSTIDAPIYIIKLIIHPSAFFH